MGITEEKALKSCLQNVVDKIGETDEEAGKTAQTLLEDYMLIRKA